MSSRKRYSLIYRWLERFICLTFNLNGSVSLTTTGYLQIYLVSPSKIEELHAHFNDKGEEYNPTFYTNPTLHLKTGSGHSIDVSQKHITKLKHPYSDCIDGENGFKTIFGGKYTKEKCQQECALRKFIRICQFPPRDSFQTYIPSSWIKEYGKSNNVTQNRACYNKYF